MHILILIKWCDQREKKMSVINSVLPVTNDFFFNLKRIGSLKASGVHSKLPPTILLKQLHLVFHCHTKADPECCHPNQMSPPSASSPTFACLRAGEGEGTDFKARNLSLCRELNRNGTSFVYTLMELGVMVIYFLLLKISTNGLWRKKCSLTFT